MINTILPLWLRFAPIALIARSHYRVLTALTTDWVDRPLCQTMINEQRTGATFVDFLIIRTLRLSASFETSPAGFRRCFCFTRLLVLLKVFLTKLLSAQHVVLAGLMFVLALLTRRAGFD